MKPFALIIEDDPKLGLIFQTALQQAGFETFLDADGIHFRGKLPENPALILLDLHLPFASGADILREIRADARWQGASIILATADLYQAKALQGQAEHILIKPIGVARLIDLARKILAERLEA